jgi:lipopolysaccharide transport system permease protein
MPLHHPGNRPAERLVSDPKAQRIRDARRLQVTVTSPPPPRVLIRPPGRFNIDLHELWQERELLLFLAGRSVKVRYKQALAGPAWALFQPLLTMIIFTLVFGHLAKLPSNGTPYPVFYFTGLVLWTYFSNAITQGANSVVENQQMVSKIYFPRAYLPLAPVIAGLLDLAIGVALALPLMTAFGRPPAPTAPLAVVGVAIALLAAAGGGLLLSGLNARYRDIKFVVPFVVQAGLFASPVAFAAALIPAQWRLLYSLNPMAGAVEWFRWSLTGQGSTPVGMAAVSGTTAVLLLAIGAWSFQRIEGTIADVV